MRLNRALTEQIRMERFEEIYGEYDADRLSTEEAALVLGCSVRHFLRLRGRYESEGLSGLKDRRVGVKSKRCAADEEIKMITSLYERRYSGFSVRHFYEFARREHGLKRGYIPLTLEELCWLRFHLRLACVRRCTRRLACGGSRLPQLFNCERYTWTRETLTKAGLVKPCKQGGKHRLRRPRRPMTGMMLHQDASKHQWFGEGYSDLVVTMDDATSEITSAFFCEEEGTQSSFRGIQETIPLAPEDYPKKSCER